jgi:ribosomal protein S3AE
VIVVDMDMGVVAAAAAAEVVAHLEEEETTTTTIMLKISEHVIARNLVVTDYGTTKPEEEMHFLLLVKVVDVGVVEAVALRALVMTDFHRSQLKQKQYRIPHRPT